MNKEQKIQHLKTMRSNYFKKLRQLQGYGNENRNPQRVQETKDSIKIVCNEINKLLKQSYDNN